MAIFITMDDSQSNFGKIMEEEKKTLCSYLEILSTLNQIDEMGFKIDGKELVKYYGKGGDIVIPDGVTTIKERAFFGCKSLTSVTISSNVSFVESKAFKDCVGLTFVTIDGDDSEESIFFISNAFEGCENLTSFIINRRRQMGYFSYDLDLENVTSVTFGKNVDDIEDSFFISLCNLVSINVSEENPNYRSIDGVLYDKDVKTMLFCPPKAKPFTLPESVEEIEFSLFFYKIGAEITILENNSKYKSIDGVLYDKEVKTLISCPYGKKTLKIPDGVIEIGRNAFMGCVNLVSVTIPDTVKEIGYFSFAGCEKLPIINIPDSVVSIEGGAFQWTMGDMVFEGMKFSPCYFDDPKTADWDWNIDFYTILPMIRERNFSYEADIKIKYYIASVIFSYHPDEKVVHDFIQENFSNIFGYLVQINQQELLNALLYSGDFVTSENIDELIDIAIDKKKYEIQLLLMHYKENKIGYADFSEKFKL